MCERQSRDGGEMSPQDGATTVPQRDGVSSGGDDLVQQRTSGRVAGRLALRERRQLVERQPDADVEQQADTGRPPV